jgi:hypothetical protein
MFPAVLADARLSSLLETAVAVDIAELLGLASPEWVTVQMLSSIAATRRATTAALAADVVVQVPEAERDTAAAIMALRATATVTDSWLNETLVVYNAANAARSGDANIADSAVNQLASSSTTLCGTTCIIVICICIVVTIGIVAATVVVWVEAKKKRQRMKDALAEAAAGEMYDVSDMDADDFEAIGAASPDHLNPFTGAPSSPLAGDFHDGFEPEAAHDDDDDDASYDAANDAMEMDSVASLDEQDETCPMSPVPSFKADARRTTRDSFAARSFSPMSGPDSASLSPEAAAARRTGLSRGSAVGTRGPSGHGSAAFRPASAEIRRSSKGDVSMDDA